MLAVDGKIDFIKVTSGNVEPVPEKQTSEQIKNAIERAWSGKS
jgi:hypothetical protein